MTPLAGPATCPPACVIPPGTYPVNDLVLLALIALAAVCGIVAIAFPMVERRYFMGSLGRAEYRNHRGILGVISTPENLCGIERMRFHFPGLLESLASPPHFGKYYFVGENAVMRPVGGARLVFLEARSSIGAPAATVALVEALRKDYAPISDEIDERIESAADRLVNEAGDPEPTASGGQVVLLSRPPGRAEARAALGQKPANGGNGDGKAKGGLRLFRGKDAAPRDALKGAPVFKSFDDIALWWADTYYYPTREYERKVVVMDESERLAKQRADPGGFLVWKQQYVEDQVNALLFYAEKDNEVSVMTEIRTGVLRKTRALEGYDYEPDGLTVRPKFTTVQEIEPLSPESRLAWFVGIAKEFARDPRRWPAEIGGRAVEVSSIADFKLSMLGAGQVDDMLTNEKNIIHDNDDKRDNHIFKMAMAAAVVIASIGFTAYLLVHH